MTENSMITVSGLCKNYLQGEVEIHALHQVFLQIDKGEFTVLAGPSGSGKTTLLNLIGGIDSPTAGEIYLDQIPLHKKTESELTKIRLEKIGFVFQAYNLLPVLTVYENIALILQVLKVERKEHQKKILPLLEELDILDLKDRYPSQLSGGQQQRVAVARSLVSNPCIVFADEPTANLDSECAFSLLDMMQRLNQEHEATFLFSSHDQRVIERAKRVVYLRDGEIEKIV